MKFLIIQTAFIGDVVLATPIIELLKKEYPQATIDFVLRQGCEGLFDRHPKLNQIFVLDKNQKFRSLVKLIKRIRKNKYNYVINVQRHFSSGLLTVLSGANKTIGFNKNPLSILFSQKIKHEINVEESMHEVERNLELIASLTSTKLGIPKLYCKVSDKKKVPEYDYVCIAPASIWFTKQFPLEKWVELINRIPRKYRVHLIGAPSDIELCTAIQSKTDSKQVLISAGQLRLLESVALIEGAKHTFTNDSAPMHFASAVNAAVTAIYCSTIPAFGFGPLSDKAKVIETDHKLDCRPCGLHGWKRCPKGHFKCSDIKVDRLLKSANL